jgi:hypothetical protein
MKLSPEEDASSALKSWDLMVGAGFPEAYLHRVRSDAAFAAWGDFTPELSKADNFFREVGIPMYLRHMKANTEATGFFKEFVGKLDQSGLVPGASTIALGKPREVDGVSFWQRFGGRVGGVQDVFFGNNHVSEYPRNNAASFTAAVVGAGELVGRGRVTAEAVLPVQYLGWSPAFEKMKMPQSSDVAARCAGAYDRAFASIGWQLEQEEKLYQSVKPTATTKAITPVLVAGKGPMTIAEIAASSNVAYNTVKPYLERLKEQGRVVEGEREGGGKKTSTFQFHGAQNTLNREGRKTPAETMGLLMRLHGGGKTETLPEERSSAKQTKGR